MKQLTNAHKGVREFIFFLLEGTQVKKDGIPGLMEDVGHLCR